MALKVCIRSESEWRTMTVRRPARVLGVQRARQHDVVGARDRQRPRRAFDGAVQHRRGFGSERRREHPPLGGKRDFRPGGRAELNRPLLVEDVSQRQRAEAILIHKNRHFHLSQDAAHVAVDRGEQHAPAIAHPQHVGARLLQVLFGDRLYRRGVAGIDGGLEPGQVGQQECRAREGLEHRGLLLVRESGSRPQVAIECRLRLGGEPYPDEEHRCADGQRREQQAREEDAVGQRSQRAHQGALRSSSTQEPEETVTARSTRGSPSCHPTTV